MNVLDLPIQEVAFKIDNEDLGVLLSALNHWGKITKPTNVETKMNIYSLRKLRQKIEVRLAQTKNSKKEFKLRIEPVQAYSMIGIMNAYLKDQPLHSYEFNVARKYRDEFHQTLHGL